MSSKTISPFRKPVKYLTNKELLAEINRCKKSFCSFIDEEYADFNLVVTDLDLVTDELLAQVCAKMSKDQSKKGEEPVVIIPHGLVVRLMTYDHVPLDPDRKRKSRAANQTHAMTTFPPFKHFVLEISEDGTKVFREVGRSHWEGGIENGWFTPDKGKVSERMGTMYKMLVERYSRRGNWRGYSYLEEMKSLALVQLCQVGLQFDESKSLNPFAFYTTTITNCLSGETEILTREYGSVPIGDVAGQRVTILDSRGDWVKCPIVSHGVRETHLNYFQDGQGQKAEIWSTANHGWVSAGSRVETSDLFGGKITKIDDLRPSKEIGDERKYRQGVQHGMIYADGSTSGKSNYRIRLCSEDKQEMSDWLSEFSFSTPPSAGGEPVYYITEGRRDLKSFPKTDDLDYLLGFIRGWFSMDGCMSKSHTPTLCGDLDEYEWLKKWGPLVGWHLNNYTKLAAVTNFGKRNKTSLNFHIRKSSIEMGDLLRSKHQLRWATKPDHRRSKTKGSKYDWEQIEELRSDGMEWQDIADKLGSKKSSLASNYCQRKKNKKNDEINERKWLVYGHKQPDHTREERVYCPVVPTTGSFALTNGIHSKNCFTRILNLEKKNQNIRDDLLVSMGAAPSYTRQSESELSQNGSIEPTKIPTRRGRKTAAQVSAEKESRKPIE